jgi:hypothetical protein
MAFHDVSCTVLPAVVASAHLRGNHAKKTRSTFNRTGHQHLGSTLQVHPQHADRLGQKVPSDQAGDQEEGRGGKAATSEDQTFQEDWMKYTRYHNLTDDELLVLCDEHYANELLTEVRLRLEEKIEELAIEKGRAYN